MPSSNRARGSDQRWEGALPGAVHDITAARPTACSTALAAAAKIRALGKQAMATFKCGRLLRKLRCSTTRITTLVKAVLTRQLAVSA